MSAESSLARLRAALTASLGPERVRTDEPMARHTFYRIGGPADLFVSAGSVEDLIAAVTLARESNVPHFILGAGSNILVSDRGIRGLAIENRARAVVWRKEEGKALVTVEAGASLSRLARQAARQGWAGLTWACGIPGTVGGGVVQNAGAHGGCMADVLQSVEILNGEGVRRHVPADELGFVYRGSLFKRPAGRGQVILSAQVALRRGDAHALAERIAEYDAWRRAHQPAGPSCGSVFKNPSHDYAGRLIEAAGLKGEQSGKAEISTLHANFIINTGGASAADVMVLIDRARFEVIRRCSVVLELEIELVGEWQA